MAAPERIKELIETFERNKGAYRSSDYKEAHLRNEFIDPFFVSLGWDVRNESGNAPQYRDVIPEDTLKVGEYTKAPDYAFCIGGVRKFFLEVKKPSVDIKVDISPAFQVRRYAWSAKLPLSILTDFEELAVYDCRVKPAKTDKASTARTLLYTYQDYENKWDEIASIFSKEAVLKGSFDVYAESMRAKKGTSEVDAAFLKEIESWRDLLARNIAIRNQNLSQRDLNYAIQTTIDRIIFLRVCEDRGIEQYGRLQALMNGADVYKRLMQIFYQADDRYNSGLFHFTPEQNRAGIPDDLTPRLLIDDPTLKEIISNLYYPESPYVFSVISADILGQVYEQFLGKVIRLTTGHRAVVEDKPEVKKAGGVYYTPTYIVDYIVENTVGKLLEGKTPRQVSKLTILDPACGSGSFLIGAYRMLLEWHRKWYEDDGPEKHKDVLYQGAGGGWFLTTAEKKRILTNNIYGVDIDPQAVEVTKLSLLLKVLEGESEETITKQLRMFKQRALPDLSNNIKCGNSLIGPDFYQNQQMSLLDEEERYRINVFDWDKEFAGIMKAGGFDAVIGNPPYVRIQNMKEWAPIEVEFYKKKYLSAGRGNYDIYVVFVERGLYLLNKQGLLGFILPNKFFNSEYGMPLREIVAKGNHLSRIVHFGANQVFSGATTYTCLLFLEKSGKDLFSFTKVIDLNAWRVKNIGDNSLIPAKGVNGLAWNFTAGEGQELFLKISSITPKLGDIADIFVGLQTSADDVFIMNVIDYNEETITLKSKALNSEWVFEKDLFFPIVSGTDVNRYIELSERQYILFPYFLKDEKPYLIDYERIKRDWPKTADYLLANKKRLEDREKGSIKGPKWYGYIYLKNMSRQNKEKLCIPRLVNNLYASYDHEGTHFLDNVDVGGITLKSQYIKQGYLYLLGLLNSKLLRWYFPHISASFRGGWFSANRQFLSQLPLRIIDLSNTTDIEYHARMKECVLEMFELHKRIANSRTSHDTQSIQRQIDAIDRQIDNLVYELYGLTDEEVKIVEGSIDTE